MDNRSEVQLQRKLVQAIHEGPQQVAQRRLTQRLQARSTQMQSITDASPFQRMGRDSEEFVQGLFDTQQRKAHEEEQPRQMRRGTVQPQGLDGDEPLQGRFDTSSVQRANESHPNQTALPHNLKAGIENLSGYSLDAVRVHYNSPKPAQVQAHAFAQGTDIHLASGQEKHLPHEAWHVVQQFQGRVRPTMQLAGVRINDDQGLEREADVMGGRANAVQWQARDTQETHSAPHHPNQTVSRYVNLAQVEEKETTGYFKGLANLFPDKNDLLIADDFTAATGKRGDKLIYSTSVRKNEANLALAGVQSPIRLDVATTQKEITLPATPPFAGQKLTKYEPQWIAGDNEPADRQQASGKLAVLPTGCNDAAYAVTGKERLTVGVGDIDGAGVQTEFQRLDTLSRVKGLGAHETGILKARMTRYLENKLKLSSIHKAHKISLTKNPAEKIQVHLVNLTLNDAGDSLDYASADTVYLDRAELSEQFDHYMDARDRAQSSLARFEGLLDLYTEKAPERLEAGMDERVDPGYGEAYSIVGGGEGFRWNFHWAGIIMKTATDNVTLENHAGVGRADGWDIRMYGRPRPPLVEDGSTRKPKHGQSFHETWKGDGFGDNPTTLRGRAVQAKSLPGTGSRNVVQRAIYLKNEQDSAIMTQAFNLFVKHVKAQNGVLVQLAEDEAMKVNLIFKSKAGKFVGEGDTTVRSGGEYGDENNLVDVGVNQESKSGTLTVNINIVTSGQLIGGGTESVERLVTTMAHEYGLHAERQAQAIMEMRSEKSNKATFEAIEELERNGGFMNEESQHGELIEETGAGYDLYMDLIGRMKGDLTKSQGVTMDRLIKEDQRDQIMNSTHGFLWKMAKLKEKGLFWIT